MFKLLKHLNKRDYAFALISVAFIVLQVFLDLRLPDYMSNITVLVNSEGSNISSIIVQGVYMLLCALGSGLASVVVGYFVAKIGGDLAYNLRAKVYGKIDEFSLKEIKSFSIASLITRTTNDITQIQQTVSMGLQALIKAPILAIWAVSKILGKSLEFSFVTATAVGILLVVVLILTVVVLPKFKVMQKNIDGLNKILRENLTGARVVKAFNAENYQEEKFSKSNKELTGTYLFIDKVMGIMSPVMTTVMSGMSLAIYWIGAFLIENSVFNVKLSIFSDMVIFMSYSMQVIMAFVLLTIIFIMLPRAVVSAKRINQVLDTKLDIIEGDFNGQTDLTGEVEFKNVGFKYPDADEYVLKNISFKAKKGETVAFIGSTGSGKSTLVNLIPRFYDATEGEILVDGVDVKKYTFKSLFNKIGYVSQTAVMFSGTVKSNLEMNENEIPQEDLTKALQISQSENFVSKMENGIDSAMVQGGKNVSGGQKQRLSIARAIAKNPEIFIFDDTFSALDYKTDKNLRGSLNSELKDSTKLIVAQRIGTIINADKIIVLNDGEMVGEGTHEELMKNCEVYKEIALSQLTEEELA